MQIKLDRIERLIQKAAAKFVSDEEAAYYSQIYLDTHLRKAPRMNPLEEVVADLKVWDQVDNREFQAEVDKVGILVLDCKGLAPALKIKTIHDELDRRARENGVAAVGYRNSTGVITLNPWSYGLAQRDLIGIAMFNGGTGCCVPHGGTRGLFGTLPMAYAIPGKGDPIVLDMAMTEVPFFDIKNAKEKGTPLPPGSAVDQLGNPTTDAAAALNDVGVANLLPLGGGFKGYGLAMLVEVLTGALVRSLLSSRQTPGWNPAEYGGLILALDVAGFTDPNRFKEEVAQLCTAIRDQPPAEGRTAVNIPGDRGHGKVAAARGQGEIVVDRKLWEELENLAG